MSKKIYARERARFGELPKYYRWNLFKSCWEYWSHGGQKWKTSITYEHCKEEFTVLLRKHIKVDFKATWCEPYEGMEE